MRIYELDAFRGVAAMAVLMYHYTTVYDKIFDTTSIFNFSYGWMGVPLFFILSGFVITLTINRCKSPFDFLYRRFMRLYPTYWICLLITLSVVYKSDFKMFQLPLIDVLMNFTMVEELFGFKLVDGSYWSLLPELLFYLLMAFLMLFKKTNNVLLFNIPILIICLIHYFWQIPFLWRILYYLPLFMIGISFYNIYIGKKENYFHILIVCNLALSIFLYHKIQSSVSVKVLFISFTSFVGLFYLFVYGKLKFLGNSKVLVFLGTISYPLYLIHENVGLIIINYLDIYFDLRNIGIVLALIISIVLAYVVTFYLEPPFNKIIKKLKFKFDNNKVLVLKKIRMDSFKNNSHLEANSREII